MTTESGAGQETSTDASASTDTKTTETTTVVEEEFDKDRALRTIKAQRASEQKALDELKSTQDELKKLKDAALSEEQRRDQRLSELESTRSALDTQLQDSRNKYAVAIAAVAAGANKVDAVARLVDFSALKIDESGEVKNADEVVAKAKEAYPELFGASATGSADGGARTSTASKSADMDAVLRSAAGH